MATTRPATAVWPSPLPLPIMYSSTALVPAVRTVTTRTSSPPFMSLLNLDEDGLVPGLGRRSADDTLPPVKPPVRRSRSCPRFRDDRTWRGPSLSAAAATLASHGSIGGLTPEDAAFALDVIQASALGKPADGQSQSFKRRVPNSARSAGSESARSHFVSTSRRSSIGSEKGASKAPQESKDQAQSVDKPSANPRSPPILRRLNRNSKEPAGGGGPVRSRRSSKEGSIWSRAFRRSVGVRAPSSKVMPFEGAPSASKEDRKEVVTIDQQLTRQSQQAKPTIDMKLTQDFLRKHDQQQYELQKAEMVKQRKHEEREERLLQQGVRRPSGLTPLNAAGGPGQQAQPPQQPSTPLASRVVPHQDNVLVLNGRGPSMGIRRGRLLSRESNGSTRSGESVESHVTHPWPAPLDAPVHAAVNAAAMAAAVATSSPPKDKGGTTARVIPFRRSSSAPAQAWSRALTPRLETLGEA